MQCRIAVFVTQFVLCWSSEFRGNIQKNIALDTKYFNAERHHKAPMFDMFWCIYWGSILLVAVLIFKIATLKTHVGEDEKSMTIGEAWATSGQEEEDDDGEDLPQNMWALNLLASLGRAKFESNNVHINIWLIVVVSAFMGTIQLSALFLMIHDLDPNADPYTIHPSTPFGSPWTVNAMKVIMTIFMVIALVSEAGQCNKVMMASLELADDQFRIQGVLVSGAADENCNGNYKLIGSTGDQDKFKNAKNVIICCRADKDEKKWIIDNDKDNTDLGQYAVITVSRSSRIIPLLMEVFQYIIAIAVTWCGVAVILSFQSVPDIIYSSMSIMCIAGVDEMFFECFDAVFGLSAEWKTSAKQKKAKSWESSGWFTAFMKFLLAFPMLLGVFVLCRAWHTGFMPTDRIRNWFH